MDDELNLEDIERLLSDHRPRRTYSQSLADIFGITLEELDKQALARPIPLSRGERIQNIMMKRYGVPESMIDALLEEYENDW